MGAGRRIRLAPHSPNVFHLEGIQSHRRRGHWVNCFMEWFAKIWASLTLTRIVYGSILFVVSMVVSLVIVGFVMVRIPENYFSSHYQHDFLPNSSWLTRWGAV